MTSTDGTQARQITDAWVRIDAWLGEHAPVTRASVQPGATDSEVAAVGEAIGVDIPIELQTLWHLCAGDDGVRGAGFFLRNQALMSLDAVATLHRQKMEAQRHNEVLNARAHEPADSTIIVWERPRIPVFSFGVNDHTYGLFLDARTGFLGRWSRFNEGDADERDTLATYLEEVADSLEAPSLATRDKPGLVDGSLVWGSMIHPSLEERWAPFRG